MKLALLAFAVVSCAMAQYTPGEPACATGCLSSAIVAAGCPTDDLGCQCGPTQATIASLVAPCLIESCAGSQLGQAASAGLALCLQYSATVKTGSAFLAGTTGTTGPTSTGTGSTGTAASTTSSTSSSPSSGGSSISSSSSSSSSSHATAIGAGVGVPLGVIAIAALVGWALWERRTRKQEARDRAGGEAVELSAEKRKDGNPPEELPALAPRHELPGPGPAPAPAPAQVWHELPAPDK